MSEILFARNDLVQVGKANGCKAIVANNIIIHTNPKGIVSCGSRTSLQVKTLSLLCEEKSIPFTAFIPSGETDLLSLQGTYTTIKQISPGYNTVIIKRAKDYAKENDFYFIPMGMAMPETISIVGGLFGNVDLTEVKRIIVPVGTGINYCAIATYLQKMKMSIPLIGIQVGLDPKKYLDSFLPFGYTPTIIKSEYPYSYSVKDASIQGVQLNPIYEAKCIPYLENGDLLWVIGF
jgi:1-aminocyclopropane-1-carboxylate deaminase/D-cysteine desulfhydrase-like pyridoxal-dependent ACC family enzyme